MAARRGRRRQTGPQREPSLRMPRPQEPFPSSPAQRAVKRNGECLVCKLCSWLEALFAADEDALDRVVRLVQQNEVGGIAGLDTPELVAKAKLLRLVP